MFGYKDLNIRKIFKGSWNLKFFALTATIGVLGLFLVSFLAYPQVSQKSEKAEAAIDWNALGSGTDIAVFSLENIDTDLYVGGGFTTAGGVSANAIAKWDGTNWSALGSGMNGNWVEALHYNGTNLYAGGDFTTAGGVPANYIAKWDGSNWSALGSGFAGEEPGGTYIITIKSNGPDIYAGGRFTTAGGNPANNIAKWDGSNWNPLGSGMNGNVYDICFMGSELYASGSFTTAGGVSANNIAKWDGTNWSPLGSGTNIGIMGMYCDGSNIIATGYFTTAGGVPVNYIAKWDGTNWSALGDGFNDIGMSIASDGIDIYVGGKFTTAGGVSANRIAKWDGSNWSALGNGTNNLINAVNYNNNNLYVGGYFTTAGGNDADHIAYYGENHINPPSSPTNLAQKQTNGTTIPSGGTINESSVKYEGGLSDPDGDTVQLCVKKSRWERCLLIRKIPVALL